MQIPKTHPIRLKGHSSPTVDQYVQWIERSTTEGWSYDWVKGWRNTEQAAQDEEATEAAEMVDTEPTGEGKQTKRHGEEEVQAEPEDQRPARQPK